MQKRMMLYFSVPLILVQIILCFLCYPQVIRRYREKTDYTVEQSINQTISFTESYLQNMTYLADMVENSWVIRILCQQRILAETGLILTSGLNIMN